MEHLKTILLILFIAGVVGAFNTIVRLSQRSGESPLRTISNALGLTAKPTPEPTRQFEFLQQELSKPQGNFTPAGSSSNQQPATSNQIPASPTPTPPSGIQAAPELPPLPPIGGVQGVKVNLPPLPPITQTLGVSASQAPELPPLPPITAEEEYSPSLGEQLDSFFQKAASFFGF